MSDTIEIGASQPSVKISSTDTIEIDSKLPETEVDVSNSVTAVVQPDNYVIASEGMFGTSSGGAPQWILDAIQEQLTTGDGNLQSVLEDLVALTRDLQLGIQQNLQQTQTAQTSISTLATSVNSKIDQNQASMLDIVGTKVTKTEAKAVSANVLSTTFNGNVDAYIGNLASVYTDAGSATATNINILQASYNEQTARIDTVEEVAVSAAKIIRSATAPTIITHPSLASGWYWIDTGNNNIEYVWNGTSWEQTTTGSAEQAVVWSANASKLITAPDGSVTGWSFGDGSNTQSNFKIKAQNFSVSDGITGYTPFTVDSTAGKIYMNAEVEFEGLGINGGSTSIDGGKIETGTLRANQLYANRLVNVDAYNADGTVNESLVTMDINLGNGSIYIK